MIGVAVTTRNRPAVLARTLAAFDQHPLPAGSRFVVVDDASTPPARNAGYRFTQNAGIPRAKNKCLELLDGCDHVFLFDDDTRPIAPAWWAPYLASGLAHAMYLFFGPPGWSPRREIAATSDYRAFDKPRGCMLYFQRRVLNAVGGADPAYGQWGYWHAEWSDRVHACGLTPHPYCDVPHSERLFDCDDAHAGATSSVADSVRQRAMVENLERYASHRGRTTRIEYPGP